MARNQACCIIVSSTDLLQLRRGDVKIHEVLSFHRDPMTGRMMRGCLPEGAGQEYLLTHEEANDNCPLGSFIYDISGGWKGYGATPQ